MTSVAGHLISNDFDERHRKWNSCDPSALFEAPIQSFVENVEPHVYCFDVLRLTALAGQEAD